jgi:membrane protease YdiL (CAAX protease family)
MVALMMGGILNGLLSDLDLAWLRFVVGTLTFQGAVLVLVQWMMREEETDWRHAFGLGVGRWSTVAGLAALVALMFLPLAWLGTYGSAELMRLFFLEPEPQAAVTTLQSSTEWWQYGTMAFLAVTVAPAAEEVLFRGLLYPLLKQRLGPFVAASLSSLAFALIHLNPMAFLSLLVLGGMLVWLYEQTGNLLAPTVAHAVFNLANLVLLQLV